MSLKKLVANRRTDTPGVSHPHLETRTNTRLKTGAYKWQNSAPFSRIGHGYCEAFSYNEWSGRVDAACTTFVASNYNYFDLKHPLFTKMCSFLQKPLYFEFEFWIPFIAFIVFNASVPSSFFVPFRFLDHAMLMESIRSVLDPWYFFDF